MSLLKQLRDTYHQNLCTYVIANRNDVPNMADVGSAASTQLARLMIEKIGLPLAQNSPSGQALGSTFALYTRDFLDAAFAQQLSHIRPGPWVLSTAQQGIGHFEQYRHLAELAELIKGKPEMKAALGGNYLITPDITITRLPFSDATLNHDGEYVDAREAVAKLTPLREGNIEGSPPILHASISCKWTMRSDRSQNTRTEALNLIRNRKGNTPRIVVVTMEPLPSRLASIALGTGDVDCTYHAALYELIYAAEASGRDDQQEMLNDLVAGRRLRDISDLPLDLAI
jgi:NgoMIV restriction enzyme